MRSPSSLAKTLHKTIQEGKRIVVLGWLKKNHDRSTRAIPDKLVRFHKKPPPSFGDATGYVICTRFISHAEIERAKKMLPPGCVYPGWVGLDEIRTLLLSVCCTSETTASSEACVPNPHLHQQPSVAVDQEYILNTAIELLEEKKMSGLSHFAVEFTKEAAKGNGLVGSRTASALREKYCQTTPMRQLLKDGWLIPVTQDGKSKTGWYKAGPKLIEASAVEPADPFERARFYIEHKKPRLERQRDELERELALINGQISSIEQMEKNFAQIVEVVSELASK